MVKKGQGFGQSSGGKKRRFLPGKKPKTAEQQAQDQAAREEVNRWRPFGGDEPMRGGSRRRNRYYDASKPSKRNPRNWE